MLLQQPAHRDVLVLEWPRSRVPLGQPGSMVPVVGRGRRRSCGADASGWLATKASTTNQVAPKAKALFSSDVTANVDGLSHPSRGSSSYALSDRPRRGLSREFRGHPGIPGARMPAVRYGWQEVESTRIDVTVIRGSAPSDRNPRAAATRWSVQPAGAE